MKYELIIYVGEDCEGARRKKGDIIDVRKPLGVLGKKEAIDHILVLVDGLDELSASRLKSGAYIDGKFEDEIDIDEKPLKIAKRRCKVDLDKLKDLDTKSALTLSVDNPFLKDKLLNKKLTSLEMIKNGK